MTNEPIQKPDDSERVMRLSTPPPPSDENNADEVVRDYEARYRPRERGEAFDQTVTETGIPARKRKPLTPRSYSNARVTDDEKLWASVAHASAWITFLGGIFTVGAIVPISIFIPLGIYFLWRRRSDYVAFHALQAFTLQLLGTVGAAVILAAGGLVWSIGLVIAVLALFILIGFILLPLWGLVGLGLALFSIVMPLAMIFYGTLAAIETYNGRDYHYPFIARWVDRQLAGGFLNAM